MKKRIKDFILFYIPGLLAFAFNCVCYMGPKPFITPERYIHINSPLDDALPFVPWFLIFYFASFLQWAFYYFGINNLNNEETYRVFSGEMFAKVFCLAIFLLFPVTIERPEITGDGFWDLIMKLVYAVDTPCCLFPSFHCFQSWMHFRFCLKHRSKAISIPVGIFTLFVFASTVLIKQHLLLDIAGGVLFAEFGQYVSNHTGIYRKFEAFCDKIRKRLTQ